MNENQIKIEKENERKSWVIAIGIHALFFIISGLGLFSCWTKPDPLIGVSEVSVVFGQSDVGSGDNIEPAENPVENPADAAPVENPSLEQPVESQSSYVESVEQSVTDVDSDVSSPNVINNTDATSINDQQASEVTNPESKATETLANDTESNVDPVENVETPVEQPNPNTMLGGGAEGKGQEDQTGTKGDPNSVMKEGGGISTGNTESGQGDGPKIDGWKFNQNPTKPNITTPGIAHIEFKINAFGKVMTAKVVGGAYSAEEREIIIKEFKKITLSKTSSSVAYKTMYSGTYDWKLQY